MFILDVAIKSQKDHKLFSATYILCSKKNLQLKYRRLPIKEVNEKSLNLSFVLSNWSILKI